MGEGTSALQLSRPPRAAPAPGATRPAVRPALLLASVLLLLSAFSLHAQERGDLSGVVVDEEGRPISGAYLQVAGTNRDAFTGSDGAFVLRRLPGGMATVEIRRIGYVDLKEDVEIDGDRSFTFRLETSPIVLDGITVMVDRLERRRRSAGVSVRTLEHERLEGATNWNAADYVRSHTNLAVGRCPGRHVAQCAHIRGRAFDVVVYIDEQQMAGGFDALSVYQANEFYLVEVYASGRMVRAYSTGFVERMAKEPRLLQPLPTLPRAY